MLNPKYKLRPYQEKGLEWLVSLYEQGLSGILADEMGLGKTLQTISLLAYLAAVKGIWGPHLIVVPTSTMLNWECEFKRFCPALKVLTYYGTAKERQVIAIRLSSVGKAQRLVARRRVSGVYHLVSARCARRIGVSSQEVGVHGAGRGAQHQELPVRALANPPSLQHKAAASAHRNASAEQSDGAVVADALPDARALPKSRGVRVLVQQPDEPDGGGRAERERAAGAPPARSAASVYSPPTEERSGEGSGAQREA